MVTGFSITQGYIYTSSQEITMEKLFEICKKVGQDQHHFIMKCLEYGLDENLQCGCKLSELTAKYMDLPTKDGTCTFHMPMKMPSGDDLEGMVLQSAYAGNGSTHRMVREQICRAFGILVLDECYKQGYSVNFSIT